MTGQASAPLDKKFISGPFKGLWFRVVYHDESNRFSELEFVYGHREKVSDELIREWKLSEPF